MELPLNILITFQEKSGSSDSMGGESETWSNVTALTNINARMRLLSGDEIIENDKRGFKSSHRAYCDYNSSITKSLRVVYNSEYYTIKFIDNPHNENEFLQIDVLKYD